MSAFIVDEETVQDTVQLLIEEGEIDEVDASVYGRRLWLLNIEAVEQRYSERYKEDGDDWAEARKEARAFVYNRRPAPMVEMVESLSSLRYQMAEGDVFHSKTYKWLERIKLRLAPE